MSTNGDKVYDLTARQAAIRVDVHIETVRRWARDGRVEGRRNMKGEWLFCAADLDRLPVHAATEGSQPSPYRGGS